MNQLYIIFLMQSEGNMYTCRKVSFTVPYRSEVHSTLNNGKSKKETWDGPVWTCQHTTSTVDLFTAFKKRIVCIFDQFYLSMELTQKNIHIMFYNEYKYTADFK